MTPRPALALTLLQACLLVGCEFGGSKKDDAGAKAREVLLVRTVAPEPRDLDEVLEVTGEAAALIEGDVLPRLSGVMVQEIRCDAGQRVEAGEILARLDDTDLKQAAAEREVAARSATIRIREAAAAIRELEAEMTGQRRTIARKAQALERARQQAEKGAIAQEDLEAAQYDLDKETSQLERLSLGIEKARIAKEMAERDQEGSDLALRKAKTDLGHVEIRAPFGGIVAKRHCSPGALASSAQPLFRLFDPASVVIQTWIPQRDLRAVRQGQRVRLRSDAVPGMELQAVVVLVSPVVEQQNGTVMVRLGVDGEKSLTDPGNAERLALPDGAALASGIRSGEALKPGLFVSGRIVIATRAGVLTVPRKAVGYLGGRPFLFVVDTPAEGSPRARRLWFEEGLGAEGIVEVVPAGPEGALRASDRVVLVGADRLKDGDPVRVEVPDMAAAAPAAVPAEPAPANGDGAGHERK